MVRLELVETRETSKGRIKDLLVNEDNKVHIADLEDKEGSQQTWIGQIGFKIKRVSYIENHLILDVSDAKALQGRGRRKFERTISMHAGYDWDFGSQQITDKAMLRVHAYKDSSKGGDMK